MLKDMLLADIATVGIDIDSLTLVLRPYHGRFLGRYDFSQRKAVVYIYSDKMRTQLRTYCSLLQTAIHEGTHHMENLEKTVMKGKTHTQRFYDLYNFYMKIAREQNLCSKVVHYE